MQEITAEKEITGGKSAGSPGRKSKGRRSGAAVNVLLAVLSVLFCAVIAASLLLPVMQVSGNVMGPSVNDGDIIVLVSAKSPKRGDIVGISRDGKTLIRRIIACGGDTVSVDGQGRVFVNGSELSEPYAKAGSGTGDLEYPVTVPEGCFFVLGDNRALASDSRLSGFGFVQGEQITGKVLIRLPFGSPEKEKP